MRANPYLRTDSSTIAPFGSPRYNGRRPKGRTDIDNFTANGGRQGLPAVGHRPGRRIISRPSDQRDRAPVLGCGMALARSPSTLHNTQRMDGTRCQL